MKDGWEMKKIGEIANFSQGIQVGLKYHEHSPKEGYVRFIRIVDYTQNTDDIRYVKDPGAKYYVKEDDIVMVRYGTPGLIGRGKSGVIANNLFKISIISNGITNNYLSLYLSQSHIQTYLSTQGSSTMPALTFGQLKKVEILYPKSLPEQKKIVTLLDAAFAKIDQAKANIEKNIANAKELFQSKLNAIFSQRGDGWEERTLKEMTTKIGSGSTPKGGQSSYKESGISLIRSMNVHDDGFRKKKLAFIDDEQASKLKNVTIQENDVLLNITGASVARCCIVDNAFLPARVNQHVSIIRLKEGLMNYKFLHYALTSKQTKSLLLDIGSQGATRQSITKVQIENFRIAFPISIDVQDKLVNSLDELRKQTTQVEMKYNQKLIDLNELKKSLLQKAFAGELSLIPKG